MFTLIYLYIINYLFTVISLFLYFFIYNTNNNITQKSFSQVWTINTTYCKQTWIFKFLVFQLSGLPPVFFFFVKFSFLISSLTYLNFFLYFVLFLNILLGIFFYLKIFNTTTLKISNKLLKDACENNTIVGNSKKSKVKYIYKYTYYLIFFLFLNIFSIIFYLDIYVIAYSIFCY
jgi:NADH:ubiquinone oxidoreductase subunit 2 (subunit N)